MPSSAIIRRTSASRKRAKPPYAVTKSACGLAPILLDGIGDTIRISLLGDPGAGNRRGVRHSASHPAARPQAGVDRLSRRAAGWRSIWKSIIAELEKRLRPQDDAVKISVLGCVVNGPGEAREADLGIAAGKGKGVIFKRGEIVRHVVEAEMVDALIEEVLLWEKSNPGKMNNEPTSLGRRKLPVLAG